MTDPGSLPPFPTMVQMPTPTIGTMTKIPAMSSLVCLHLHGLAWQMHKGRPSNCRPSMVETQIPHLRTAVCSSPTLPEGTVCRWEIEAGPGAALAAPPASKGADVAIPGDCAVDGLTTAAIGCKAAERPLLARRRAAGAAAGEAFACPGGCALDGPTTPAAGQETVEATILARGRAAGAVAAEAVALLGGCAVDSPSTTAAGPEPAGALRSASRRAANAAASEASACLGGCEVDGPTSVAASGDILA